VQLTTSPTNSRTIPGLEALVLVGGLGTRLRSAVNDRPKAMAMVAGRPFLEWLIEDLRQQGVERLVLCTGYMSDYIENHFASGQWSGLEIVYSRESRPLGTAGALKLALQEVRGPRFFALNGDTFCDFDLHALLDTHLQQKALATLWLVSVADSERYGAITIDSRHEITEFHEKSKSERKGLINAGVYLLERQIVEALSEGTARSLEQDVFPGLLGRGIFGVIGKGPFLDIGTAESYKMADLFIKRHRA
jgi:D-glycero-alpha-D-manno-heptose 1-phosphate guanylyltransferase